MSNRQNSEDDVDRGRAWVVLTAAFSAVLFLCTILYMNGLYFAVFVEHYGEDLTKTSMIGALNSALLCLLAPVVSVFMDTFSCRICMIVGRFLLSISYFVSFFFKSVNVYIFTIGIIGGVGNSFAGIPPSVLLAYHFDRWRNVIISFKEVVAGFGMFLASPVFFWLIHMFEINGSFLILSGLALQISVCGFLCAPNSQEIKLQKTKCNVENRNKDTHPKIFLRRVKASILLSFSLSKDVSIVLFMLSTLSWNAISSAVTLHLPRYMVANGSDEGAIVAVISIFASCNALGRVCAASTTGKRGKDSYILHIGLLGILSLSAILFPLYGGWSSAAYLFSSVCGFYTGSATALMVTITIGLVRVEKLTSAYGLVYFFSGEGVLVGPPLLGLVYEATCSYEYSFMTVGFIGLLGVTASLVAFKDKDSLNIIDNLEYEVPLNDKYVLTNLTENDKVNSTEQMDCQGDDKLDLF